MCASRSEQPYQHNAIVIFYGAVPPKLWLCRHTKTAGRATWCNRGPRYYGFAAGAAVGFAAVFFGVGFGIEGACGFGFQKVGSPAAKSFGT